MNHKEIREYSQEAQGDRGASIPSRLPDLSDLPVILSLISLYFAPLMITRRSGSAYRKLKEIGEPSSLPDSLTSPISLCSVHEWVDESPIADYPRHLG